MSHVHVHAWKLLEITFVWVLAFGKEKTVAYISFHSADRMTWDENESYYLGDLHLLDIAFVSKLF